MIQLTYHQTIDYYEGPTEFFAIDQNDVLYIATTPGEDVPATDFIAVPLSAQQYHDLQNTEMDLRDLMLQNGQCQWFLLKLADDWTIQAVEQNTPIADSGLLPESAAVTDCGPPPPPHQLRSAISPSE